MKSSRIILMSLLVGSFILSCQKEHIATTNTTIGNPVFYFNGTVGGNNVSLQAGKNNYYMYSSYSQNSTGVYSYIGNLKEFGCNNGCASSIEFIINNYRALPAGNPEKNISDSSLSTGYYSYASLSGIPTKFNVTFNSSIGLGSNPISYTYNFGDGTIQTISGAPPTSLNHIYYTQGSYNTSLSVTFAGNHITSLSDSLHLGILKKTIIATLSYTDTNVVVYTVAIKGGTLPYNIMWSFGDTSTGNPNTSTHTNDSSTTDTAAHVYVSKQLHKATVTIQDSKGISVIANTNIVPPGGNTTYAMNYSIAAPTTDTLGLSNVKIIYTDPTGDIYTTADSITQKPGSNFQIISVAPYNNNENNQTTKQLHIKFNCTLYDNKGKSLAINGGDAVIAVAYK